MGVWSVGWAYDGVKPSRAWLEKAMCAEPGEFGYEELLDMYYECCYG